MSTGTRRNGKQRFRFSPQSQVRRNSSYGARHAGPPRDPALRAGKIAFRPWLGVPAVVMAAALAAGGVLYGITGAGAGAVHGNLTAEMVSLPSQPHGASLRVPASGGVADVGNARIQAATRQVLRRAATQAAPSPSARPSAPQRPAVLSCSHNHSLLPYNVTTIVSFLVRHGYSRYAAAGIAGNIYQESKGDPEAVGMGGGGLIGFTPLPAGYVTGNAYSDLQRQLEAVLTYNQQWSSYLPALNKASSPSSAAYIYVTYFERAGIPQTATREASARAVASACGL